MKKPRSWTRSETRAHASSAGLTFVVLQFDLVQGRDGSTNQPFGLVGTTVR